MSIIDDLLTRLPAGTVVDVRVGAFWTAVVVEVAGQQRCGLASTLRNNDHHTFAGLLALCRPDALVMVLGPSTPLSPVLFDYKSIYSPDRSWKILKQWSGGSARERTFASFAGRECG